MILDLDSSPGTERKDTVPDKNVIAYHDTFQDFVQGSLDASGQNIYISRDGKIRTIHRFDINDDGWIDLVYPQTHDYANMIPASLGTVTTDREIKSTELYVDGSLKAVHADLNKDGWTDMVFCPNHDGIQHPRRFVTTIFGGPDGWPASRSNGALPVNGALDIAVADINGDSWPDIVTLNSEAWLPGQPEGNIIRTYWGSERGFLLTRKKDLGVKSATAIISSDFDNDGSEDIAVLTDNGTINVLWGKESSPDNIELTITEIHAGDSNSTGIFLGDLNNDGNSDLLLGNHLETITIVKGDAGRSWHNPESISGYRASDIEIEDIDRDGRSDLLFTYYSQQRAGGGELVGAGKGTESAATILWGSENGLDLSNPMRIEAKFLKSITSGDYDGDGNTDLALAIHQGEKEFRTNSNILFSNGDRSFSEAKGGVITQGAYDALTISGKKGDPDIVVFSNVSGGIIDEKVPTYIYWGGETGFDADNKLVIPFRSGYESSAADFNADGFIDLIVCNATHHSEKTDPYGGINIFWGNEDGLDLENRTVLREYFLASTNTADLNKDGYLDLVAGQYFNDVEDRDQTNVYIYYGSADGFDPDKRVEIPSRVRSLSVQLADYDNDGWLDIACNSYGVIGVRIFFGSESGFREDNSKYLDSPSVADLETADLNGDGWLDIVACNYQDYEAGIFDLGTTIFWGSETGFHHWNAQRLPGSAPLGPVVADWDNDGFLDLFTPQYHGNRTREALPSYIFWGSAEGFHRLNKTTLINDSGAEGVAADYDKDGLLDLAVANHTVDGDHMAFSKVYYNDGNRFDDPRIEKLPTFGPHWSSNSDIGHIADRSWLQSYESSIIELKKRVKVAKLEIGMEKKEGGQTRVLTRSAADTQSLIAAVWIPLQKGEFQLERSDKFIQYKIILESDNGDRFPIIDWVKIESD